MDKTVNVAMIGLGFGAEFIPIYQAHANANVVAICRRNEAELNKCGDAFGIEKRYTNYDDVLVDDEVDYVMQIMTNNKIRHLPIVNRNKVVGLISIGDVISSNLEKTLVENHKLHDYLELSGQL